MKENLEGKVRKSVLISLALAATFGYVVYSHDIFRLGFTSVWDMVFRRDGIFVCSQGKEYFLREVVLPEHKGMSLAGHTPQLMATAQIIPCDADVKIRVYSSTPTPLEISCFTDDGRVDGTIKLMVSKDQEVGIGSLPSGEYLVKRLSDPLSYSAFRLR